MSFHLQYSLFLVSLKTQPRTSFSLNSLKNGYTKYFKNFIKSLHFFQGLIWRIYCWGASKLIQIFLPKNHVIFMKLCTSCPTFSSFWPFKISCKRKKEAKFLILSPSEKCQKVLWKMKWKATFVLRSYMWCVLALTWYPHHLNDWWMLSEGGSQNWFKGRLRTRKLGQTQNWYFKDHENRFDFNTEQMLWEYWTCQK